MTPQSPKRKSSPPSSPVPRTSLASHTPPIPSSPCQTPEPKAVHPTIGRNYANISPSEWQTIPKSSRRTNTTPSKKINSTFTHTNPYNILHHFEPQAVISMNPEKVQRGQHPFRHDKTRSRQPPPSQMPLKQSAPAAPTQASPRRPQVVVNEYPESVTTWKKTAPGNATYAAAVKHGRHVTLYSDSICNLMSKWQLNKMATDAGVHCNINKKPFVGATSEDLSTHHMLPTLKKNTPDEVIIHAGINDVMQLANRDGSMTSEVISIIANNIIQCGRVARANGVNKVCISGITPRRGNIFQQTISHVNYQVENLCRGEGFNFINNSNIHYIPPTAVDEGLHFKDGLHLNVAGRNILMENFISYLGTH